MGWAEPSRPVDPILPKTRATTRKKLTEADEKHRVEDSMKTEFLGNLSERAERFLQVQGVVFVPDRPFEAPSVHPCESGDRRHCQYG